MKKWHHQPHSWGRGGGKNVPKTFEVTGPTTCPLPFAFFFFFFNLRTFPFFALMCFTVWLLFLISPCFNSCASPSSYHCPHPLFPPLLLCFALRRPEECEEHIWNLLEKERENKKGVEWKEKGEDGEREWWGKEGRKGTESLPRSKQAGEDKRIEMDKAREVIKIVPLTLELTQSQRWNSGRKKK